MASNMISFQYIETDLRGIAQEAASKKTLPHIRDKTDRVLFLILGKGDDSEPEHVVGEIVSTLLLTSELTHTPKILYGTINALIKLCGQPGAVHGVNYSHIVTVLCKATYSLMSLIPSNNESVPQELELSLLRCLQVVSLLAVDSLRDQFLDEVSLSQLLALSANLITRKNTGPVVSQTAKGVLNHIQMFIIESAIKYSTHAIELSNYQVPPGSTLTATGEQMGVAHLSSNQSNSPLSVLFSFMHDFITMSDPESTIQVPCLLFGSSRIPRLLALDMLSDSVSRAPWNKHAPLITLGKLYLFPILSRRIQNILSADNPTESAPFWFCLASSIFNSSLVPFARFETEKIVVILNNFLSTTHQADARLSHVMKSLTSLVVSGHFRSSQDLSVQATPNSPLGGDSPVNKLSSRNRSCLVESVIDNVALYVSKTFANFGQDSITDKKLILSKEFPPIDLITAFVSALYRDEQAAQDVESSWAPIMSVFQLIVPLESSLDSFTTFILLLARHKIRRGLSSAIALVVELSNDEFVFSITSRMIEDDSFSMDESDWSILIRSLSHRQKSCRIFSSVRTRARAETVVQALIPINSKWTIESVAELLMKSPGGLDNISHLWASFVGPYFHSSKIVSDLVPDVILLATRVVETVLVSSENKDDSIIFSTIVDVSEKHPKQVSSLLLELVQNFGHRISDWKSVIACISNIENLKIIEIIIDEFLDRNILFIPQLVLVLQKLLPKESTNNSFLIVSLVQRCWRVEAFSAISNFFKLACIDSRMDVRNCAIKTLTNLPIADLSLLLDITDSVNEHASSCSHTDRSRDEEETAGLIVHHSQDTEEKRWAESLSCCLRMLSNAARNHPNPQSIIDSSVIGQILNRIFADQDTSQISAIELFVNLIRKSSPVSAPPLFVSIIEQQTVEITKTTRLMLPDLLAGHIPEPLVEIIFSLFAKFISHHSVRINKPIPSRIVSETDTGDCVVDYSQLRIDPTISIMIPNMKLFFNNSMFIDLIFKTDSFLVDTGSLHLGLRMMDHLIDADLDPTVRARFISRLEHISLQQDSRGIWKHALCSLVKLNGTESMINMFDLLPINELVSPIQYRLFVSLVEKIEVVNVRFCKTIIRHLSTCDGSDLNLGSKSHYLVYMFLTVLAGTTRDGKPPPFSDPTPFSYEQIIGRKYALSTTQELSECVFALALKFVNNQTSDIITVPILSVLENDVGFKLFLAILPGSQLVMSENIEVRKSFSRALDRFTPRIKNMC